MLKISGPGPDPDYELDPVWDLTYGCFTLWMVCLLDPVWTQAGSEHRASSPAFCHLVPVVSYGQLGCPVNAGTILSTLAEFVTALRPRR